MLTPSKEQQILPRWSRKLATFDCSCGQKKVVKRWVNVATGKTRSCGQCSILPCSYWQTAKFGKLRMLKPMDLKPRSSSIMEWTCDCGKIMHAPVARVTSGSAKSCGRCNEIGTNEWTAAKFGKLRMREPMTIHKSSGKKVWWTCDCGKEALLPVIAVTHGHNTSCGSCGVKSVEFWTSTKFGRLRMSSPQDVAIRSNKKVEWICDCGGALTAIVQNVTRGRTVSCGKCRSSVDAWFQRHQAKIQALKPPVKPTDLPSGPFVLLENATRANKPTAALCSACGRRYFPRWQHVRVGTALTCGCSTNRVSRGQKEVLEFVLSLKLDAQLEHKIDALVYDVFVPAKNLLIEYQGTKWHSMPGAKQRDMEKFRHATQNGYKMMAVYEDEWSLKRPQMQRLIQNRLGATEPRVVLRASQAKVQQVSSNESNKFYDEFHYIGRCRAMVNYGAFVDGRLAACCSFSNPTRQSRHPWELVRMASDPSFRIHGVWGKLLKSFVSERHPSSIVSFSDNRLFDGHVYSKLGFEHDGDTPQSYYWVKNGKRFNKSGLRKQGTERTSAMTETQLRQAQGYAKIWDLGKKRWVWRQPVADSRSS